MIQISQSPGIGYVCKSLPCIHQDVYYDGSLIQSDGYIDGLVQDWSHLIANTLELLQSCTQPSIYFSNTASGLQTYLLIAYNDQGALSLTWFNFNPSMDKQLYSL